MSLSAFTLVATLSGCTAFQALDLFPSESATSAAAVKTSTPAPSTPVTTRDFTLDNLPEVSGNAEPGTIIGVLSNGKLVTKVTTDTNGVWRLADADRNKLLTVGSHDIQVITYDAAGQPTSKLSPINRLVIAPAGTDLSSLRTPPAAGTSEPSSAGSSTTGASTAGAGGNPSAGTQGNVITNTGAGSVGGAGTGVSGSAGLGNAAPPAATGSTRPQQSEVPAQPTFATTGTNVNTNAPTTPAAPVKPTTASTPTTSGGASSSGAPQPNTTQGNSATPTYENNGVVTFEASTPERTMTTQADNPQATASTSVDFAP